MCGPTPNGCDWAGMASGRVSEVPKTVQPLVRDACRKRMRLCTVCTGYHSSALALARLTVGVSGALGRPRWAGREKGIGGAPGRAP